MSEVCAQLQRHDDALGVHLDLASGGSLTVTIGATGAIKARGTYKVQCCIHPWMRTTVVVQ